MWRPHVAEEQTLDENFTLGWVVVAKVGSPTRRAMPAAPIVLDTLTTREQAGLPTLCGVWRDREGAEGALSGIPTEYRDLFAVRPVALHILSEGGLS